MPKQIDVSSYTEDVYGTNTLAGADVAVAETGLQIGEAILDYKRGKKVQAFAHDIAEVDSRAEAALANRGVGLPTDNTIANILDPAAVQRLQDSDDPKEKKMGDEFATNFLITELQGAHALLASGQASAAVQTDLILRGKSLFANAMASTSDPEVRNRLGQEYTMFSSHSPNMAALAAYVKADTFEGELAEKRIDFIIADANSLGVPDVYKYGTNEFFFEYTVRKRLRNERLDNEEERERLLAKEQMSPDDRDTAWRTFSDDFTHKEEWKEALAEVKKISEVVGKIQNGNAETEDMLYYQNEWPKIRAQLDTDMLILRNEIETTHNNIVPYDPKISGIETPRQKLINEQADALYKLVDKMVESINGVETLANPTQVAQSVEAMSKIKLSILYPQAHDLAMRTSLFSNLIKLAIDTQAFAGENKITEDQAQAIADPIVRFILTDTSPVQRGMSAVAASNWTNLQVPDNATQYTINNAASQHVHERTQTVNENWEGIYPETEGRMKIGQQAELIKYHKATSSMAMLHSRYNGLEDEAIIDMPENRRVLVTQLDEASILFNIATNRPESNQADGGINRAQLGSLETYFLGRRSEDTGRYNLIKVLSSLRGEDIPAQERVVLQSTSEVLNNYLLRHREFGLVARRDELGLAANTVITIDGEKRVLDDIMTVDDELLESEGRIVFNLPTQKDLVDMLEHKIGQPKFGEHQNYEDLYSIVNEIERSVNQFINLYAAQELLARPNQKEPDFRAAWEAFK